MEWAHHFIRDQSYFGSFKLVRKGSVNFTLIAISIVCGCLAAEGLSRLVVPLSPGTKNISHSGDPVSPVGSHPFRLNAGLTYQQVSNEFDVRTTIDRFGNRVPEPQESPEVLFLGDSFTFGHGLSDEETFVHIYCSQMQISCSNLGRSGTGTGSQINILEHYLDSENWRPREVKLFILAMTGALVPGNDLFDNYFSRRAELEQDTLNAGVGAGVKFKGTNASRILRLRNFVLGTSNLARFVYFSIGPWVRTSFAPAPDANVLRDSLQITRSQFLRLAGLAKRYEFDYRIYVIHPVQDILRGTSGDTLRALQKLTESGRVIGTAWTFFKDPSSFYYAYDGHFNKRGSRRIAEFLLSESLERS
jgi:hypothetical protein